MGETIHQIVRQAQTNYTSGTVKIGKYVDISIYEIIETITAYLNSKHITGDKDSLGRDKPFFNIVTAAVNVWYRATDLDRKDMILRTDKGRNELAAFLASIFLQKWMKKNRFGVFLNHWGRTLAQYGSAIVKFVEKGEKLICQVLSWNRVIIDPIDFEAQPVIEQIYKTPAQLRRMEEYDQEMVDQLIEAKTTRRNLNNENVDNLDEFIELYQVDGELPIALLKEPDKRKDKDWKQYVQQFHVISFMADEEGKFKDFTLYKGKSKPMHLKTDLIEESGRSIAIGAVEHLFDPQWMVNHSKKAVKDTLDIASKLLLQSADPSFKDKNLIDAVETGNIFTHEPNKPLTQINTAKPDVVSMENFGNSWMVNGKDITSTPDALRGNTLPSGTPYSLGAYLGEQGSSLFEIMTENKALSVEEMLRVWIIPHLKKTMLNNKDELKAELTDRQIEFIDAIYIPKEAVKRFNDATKEKILSGVPVSPFNRANAEMQIKNEVATMGKTRTFTPDDLNWKEVFKDFEWEVDVGITNESSDKKTLLASLSSIIQVIGRLNKGVLRDKLLGQVGAVSPLELGGAPAVEPEVNEALKTLIPT